MGKQLLVISGPDKGRVFPIPQGDVLLLGRSKAAEGRLNDPRVSKVHCMVEWQGERVTITDHESTCGTFVNGQQVTAQLLQPGDVIRVGDTQLRLHEDGLASSETPQDETLMVSGSSAAQVPVTPPAGVGDLTGTTLSHYVLGSVLARGQSGVVYQALDSQKNRKVAVKVLVPEFTRNDEDVQRFVRAMRTMLPLRHPNLVAIYGAGKTGPHCWSAMEFVEGENLEQVIQRSGTAGKLDWQQSLRVAIQVARALEYAHQHAIIHRNITPQNVLLRTSDDVVKLGDLILVKALGGMLAEKITRAGAVVGDFRYTSPESTLGPAGVDGRSDLYSLGALLYALLAGRPPIEGPSVVQTLLRIRQEEPAPPTKSQPSIPAPVEAMVLKLLQKRPEDRYQTATEALRELEALAAAHGIAS